MVGVWIVRAMEERSISRSGWEEASRRRMDEPGVISIGRAVDTVLPPLEGLREG